MSESTLSLTCGKINIVKLNKEEFYKNKVVIEKNDVYKEYFEYCTVGYIGTFNLVVIVNEKTEILPYDNIGEIWIAGPMIFNGYHNDKEKTKNSFQKSISDSKTNYFKTGDIGFIHESQLYIVGRKKEVIIIRGKNYYPLDIEKDLLNCSKYLRKGCVIAVSLNKNKQEELLIICEIHKNFKLKTNELVHDIIKSVVYNHDIKPNVIVLNPNSIKKTTSGKWKRILMKQEYLNNNLKILNSSIEINSKL